MPALSATEYRETLQLLQNRGHPDSTETKLHAACSHRNPFFELETFDLDLRTKNILLNNKIRTLYAVVTMTPKQLRRLNSFGPDSLDKLTTHLAQYNLKLGMQNSDIRAWIKTRLGGLEP
jgi:DNA-directed RNA polymerase alpha subunit